MSNPLITVIVPCFNSSESIVRCLDSIDGQTFGDFEIIAVDGLSSDNTPDLLKEYAATHSRFRWLSEKDNGIYDAINKGVKMAKGTWIYILGSDDSLYAPSVLESAVPFLLKLSGGAFYGNVKVSGDAGWAKDGEVHDGEFPIEKLLQRNICQQAVFYHRSLFDKIGYFKTEYTVCADWDFILHCAAVAGIRYGNIIIALFTGGGTSKTVKEVRFYEDLPGNLYDYFGFRVFRKEFRPAGWRFRKAAQVYAAGGKRFSSLIFRLIARRHGA